MTLVMLYPFMKDGRLYWVDLDQIRSRPAKPVRNYRPAWLYALAIATWAAIVGWVLR